MLLGFLFWYWLAISQRGSLNPEVAVDGHRAVDLRADRDRDRRLRDHTTSASTVFAIASVIWTTAWRKHPLPALKSFLLLARQNLFQLCIDTFLQIRQSFPLFFVQFK